MEVSDSCLVAVVATFFVAWPAPLPLAEGAGRLFSNVIMDRVKGTSRVSPGETNFFARRISLLLLRETRLLDLRQNWDANYGLVVVRYIF